MKKKDRQEVFDKYGGRCSYCGCELDSTWQVDHAVAKRIWIYTHATMEGVNDMINLMPSCAVCNHYKRSKQIENMGELLIGFRDYMLKFHVRLKRYPKNTRSSESAKKKVYMQRIADRYGITIDKPFNGVFYFETYVKP